jgi:hypothetical protein
MTKPAPHAATSPLLSRLLATRRITLMVNVTKSSHDILDIQATATPHHFEAAEEIYDGAFKNKTTVFDCPCTKGFVRMRLARVHDPSCGVRYS